MVLATRGSPLARWQAERVASLLGAIPGFPGSVVRVVHTTGDHRIDAPLTELGGQGVFVAEVQEAVASGSADLAVHSAKDLPARSPRGLRLACVPERADPRDALVGASLADLHPGATVATSSPRRRAQLAWLRPDLRFVEIRGNIGTRLARVRSRADHGIDRASAKSEVDALVVAHAALNRLGLADLAAEVLSPATMLPQVGQGALAVECRSDDAAMLAWLRRIDDPAAHLAVDAERAFLAAVGGGCRTPVAAWAVAQLAGPGQYQLALQAMVASGDGHIVLRRRMEGTDPQAVGAAALEEMIERDGAGVLDGLLPRRSRGRSPGPAPGGGRS